MPIYGLCSLNNTLGTGPMTTIKNIIKELSPDQQALYDCAVAVEKNEPLNKEMQDWEITLNDGIK